MNSSSIELDKIKEDTPIPKIIRTSFRVPVEDGKNIWVLIHNTRYAIQDICAGGISITVRDQSAFLIDQALLNCELNYFDIVIKNLNGRIVHISAALDQDWKYGIQWTDLKKDSSDRILSIVKELKEQVLGKDKNSPDDI